MTKEHLSVNKAVFRATIRGGKRLDTYDDDPLDAQTEHILMKPMR